MKTNATTRRPLRATVTLGAVAALALTGALIGPGQTAPRVTVALSGRRVVAFVFMMLCLPFT